MFKTDAKYSGGEISITNSEGRGGNDVTFKVILDGGQFSQMSPTTDSQNRQVLTIEGPFEFRDLVEAIKKYSHSQTKYPFGSTY
jgi:hypothetical protein